MRECWSARHEDGVFVWETTLGFRECDERKQQRLSSLLDLLAESAGRDYALRGFSHERLVELRQVFLLSRLRLRIFRPFRHAERVTVRTWENGVVGARIRRDYELLDGAGVCRVAARSEWLLADPVEHRLLRPRFSEREVASGGRIPDCPDCDKLPHRAEGLPLLGSRTVLPSQLDGNGHLYSARYGDLLTDLLPDGGRAIRDFSINYVKECRAGETLALRGRLGAGGALLLGLAGDETRFSCRAEG